MVSSSAVTLALLSFFSTTVDDFCVILIFFAREYVKTHSLRDTDTIKSFIKISVGQTLGFTFILIVSLCLGIGLHSVVNNDYVDLIGLLPVCIGLYKVYELFAESIQNCTCCKTYVAIENGLEETDDDDLEENKNPKTVVSPRKNEEEIKDDNDVELTTIVLNNRPKSEVSTDSETILTNDNEEEMETILNEEAFETLNELDTSNSYVVCAKNMFSFLDPLTFEVAIYAIMFGTDNIAIYVALFSSVSLLETLGVSLFFYSLLFLYLIMAIFIIVKCPRIGKWIGDNANYLVPAVLIILGLYILHDSILWKSMFP